MAKQDQFDARSLRLQHAVEAAVQAGDAIILAASDGSVEETNWLTGQIAGKFAEKVQIALQHALSKRDFMADVEVSPDVLGATRFLKGR
jgi:hypothetical protein